MDRYFPTRKLLQATLICIPVAAGASGCQVANSEKEGGETRIALMNRYIVTHNCSKGQEQKIARTMEAGTYRLVEVFDFTPQFVIEAQENAIARLRSNPCVQSIQPDRLDSPSGLSNSSG